MNQTGGSWSSNEPWNPPSFSFPPSSSSSFSSYQHHLPSPSAETSPYIQAIRSAGPHQAKKDLFEAVLRSDKASKLAALMQLRREEVVVVKEDKTRVMVECQRCEEEFDVDTYEDDCMYHSGESLLSPLVRAEAPFELPSPPSLSLSLVAGKLKCTAQDQEDWEDNDGKGRLNTKKNKEEYPHLFTWSCCGKSGGSRDGCKRGKHVDPDSD